MEVTSDPEDQIDDYIISPPNNEPQLKSVPNISISRNSVAPKTPKKKLKLRRRRIDSSILPESPPPPAQTFNFLNLLLIICGISILIITPFYILSAFLPNYEQISEERRILVNDIEERISFVQSLLGQVSRNVTQVPGKTVKDQWERYWEQQDINHIKDILQVSVQPNSYFSSFLSYLGSLLWLLLKGSIFFSISCLIGITVYNFTTK